MVKIIDLNQKYINILRKHYKNKSRTNFDFEKSSIKNNTYELTKEDIDIIKEGVQETLQKIINNGRSSNNMFNSFASEMDYLSEIQNRINPKLNEQKVNNSQKVIKIGNDVLTKNKAKGNTAEDNIMTFSINDLNSIMNSLLKQYYDRVNEKKLKLLEKIKDNPVRNTRSLEMLSENIKSSNYIPISIFRNYDLQIIRQEIRVYIFSYIKKNKNSNISRSLAIILKPWKNLSFTNIENFNKEYNALLKLQGLPKDIIMYLELYKLIDSLLSNNKDIFNVEDIITINISRSLAIILEPWKNSRFTNIENFYKKNNALLKLQGLPKNIIMYLELNKLIDSLSNNKNIFNEEDIITINMNHLIYIMTVLFKKVFDKEYLYMF